MSQMVVSTTNDTLFHPQCLRCQGSQGSRPIRGNRGTYGSIQMMRRKGDGARGNSACGASGGRGAQSDAPHDPTREVSIFGSSYMRPPVFIPSRVTSVGYSWIGEYTVPV